MGRATQIGGECRKREWPNLHGRQDIKRASNPNSDLRNLRSFPSTRVSFKIAAFSILRKASTTTTGWRKPRGFLRGGQRVRPKRLTCTDAKMASPHLIAPRDIRTYLTLQPLVSENRAIAVVDALTLLSPLECWLLGRISGMHGCWPASGVSEVPSRAEVKQ